VDRSAITSSNAGDANSISADAQASASSLVGTAIIIYLLPAYDPGPICSVHRLFFYIDIYTRDRGRSNSGNNTESEPRIRQQAVMTAISGLDDSAWPGRAMGTKPKGPTFFTLFHVRLACLVLIYLAIKWFSKKDLAVSSPIWPLHLV
jgi:hypothetical protein